MTNYLRSDENASLSEIERAQSRDKTFKKAIKTGATLGTAAIGGGISAKILPLLNSYVPEDLALKGITKLFPELGKNLKKGSSLGLNLRDGLNFIKDQISPKEDSNQEKTKDNRNIIEQYSPDLHQAISQEIKKGRSPIEATNIAAFQDKKFDSIIKKIIKDHKVPFSSLIQSIYGNGEMGQPSQQMNPQDQGQQQGQVGQGQQALMSILQKLQQSRGM